MPAHAGIHVFSNRAIRHNIAEMKPTFEIEPAGAHDFGSCPCCGNSSRTVWGYVHRESGTKAAYYVQWTLGHVPEHGANVDLIIGKWGDNSTKEMRQTISMEFRLTDTGPWFMVIDANTRPFASNANVGRSLSRDEVIGTALAPEAFSIVDAIWLNDPRIEELRTA